MDLLQLQNRLIKLTALEEFGSLEIFRDEFLNVHLDGFDGYVQFKPDKYYSATLYRTDKFEIRLLCWKPLQEAPRHPHPQNGCLTKILKGELIEEKFKDTRCIKTVYKKGEVGYIRATETHTLKNSDTSSVSLHIYSPAGFYDTINKH